MMKINKSDLLCIAAKPAQYPSADAVEIAFAGRSNVGKSSLINLLLGFFNGVAVGGGAVGGEVWAGAGVSVARAVAVGAGDASFLSPSS